MSESLYIAFDFDGTYVEHAYPKVGKSTEAAIWLRLFAEYGAKLILWTFRHGRELEEAVKVVNKDKVPLFGINKNPDNDSGSPKAYATLVIDDISFGVPLRSTHRGRPVVDWSKVGPAVAARLQIPQEAIKKAFEVESQKTLNTLVERLGKLEELLGVKTSTKDEPEEDHPKSKSLTPESKARLDALADSYREAPKPEPEPPVTTKCLGKYQDSYGQKRSCKPWEGCGLDNCIFGLAKKQLQKVQYYTSPFPVSLLIADE